MRIIDRVKFDGLADKDWLVYKCPEEDLSTATKLIVGESQVAVFVKGGQALDLFPPGSYTLSTENIPFLNKLINLPYGGNTPFSAEIYYINTISKLDLFWGTKDRIQLIDPKYNVRLRIRAFGQLGVKVENYGVFLSELVGTLGPKQVCDYTEVVNYFKSLLVTRLKTIIASEIINNKISALEITAHLDTLSNNAVAKIQEEFAKFGIKIVNFFIESINFPDEDFEAINEILKHKASLDIIGEDRYSKIRSFDVYEQAAANQGGAGSVATNLGLGYVIANNLGENLNNSFAKNHTEEKKSMIGGKTCGCGHENAVDAKFCVSCGARLIEEKIICGKCKHENPKNSKFCSQCGNNIVDKTCDKCGSANSNAAKFCFNCGDTFEE